MTNLQTPSALKEQARMLRVFLGKNGHELSHARALEAIAHINGFRDWNTCSALATEAAASGGEDFAWQVDQKISGKWFGKPVSGAIRAVQKLRNDLARLVIQFDEPIDMATSPHITANRRRVTCVVRSDGVSPEKAGDGTPHLVLSR